MRTLGRIIWVPLAFLLAMLVAGLVLVTLGQERIVQGVSGRGPSESTIDAAFQLLSLARVLFSWTTLVPALLLIIVGEVARIRQSAFYVVGGGVAMAAVPLLARLDPAAVLSTPHAVWQVFATAGFAGGFVYWLLAGRSA
jgi:hypothetical protein